MDENENKKVPARKNNTHMGIALILTLIVIAITFVLIYYKYKLNVKYGPASLLR